MAHVTASPLPTDIPSVTDVVTDSLSMAQEATGRLIDNLPVVGTRLLFAALAIIGGFFLLRIGRRIIQRVFRQKEGARQRTVQQKETLHSLINSVFSYLVYFIIATVVLSIFGVNISSILAVAGVGGVAIGFGAQTLVKDIISGIFLWAEGNISVGDIIGVNGMTGTVESISLRTTTIRDFGGDLYVVPNGDIRTVINKSRDFKRALVTVRLNYEEDLSLMLHILQDEMNQSKAAIEGLRETPQVLGITDMPGDAIQVQVAALCEPNAAVTVERAIRQRIKLRFDREGILLPHAPIMATPRTENRHE